MRKYFFILPCLFVFLLANIVNGIGINSDTKTIPINRFLQVQVSKANQKQSVIVPVNSLDFDTTLEWNVKIDKKNLASEKDPAYFVIESTETPAKRIEYRTVSGSGKLVIPKGTQYKMTLYAGEYSLLVTRDGATVQAGLKYMEARVQYSLGDQPYQINFEVTGPAGLSNWSWQWSSNSSSSGDKVSHQFSDAGNSSVIIEGKGKLSNGDTSQKFYCNVDVPPLLQMDPKVDPLKGPVELNLTGKVNAMVNYGQKATYTWNFGNGTETSGSEVNGTIVTPGQYQVLLTAKVGDYTFQRNWQVMAEPLNIMPNAVLSQPSGPIPFDVTGTVNPTIYGGPTQLKFSWEVGKETIEGKDFTYRFKEPGDYQVILRTVDKLHPDLLIPEQVFVVKALTPQLTMKPTVSIEKGIIPLKADFDPVLKVTGSPVELIYRWDFGDGEISNQEKPAHVFKKPGLYNVQLTVSDRLHPGNLIATSLKIEALPPEMTVALKSNASKGLAPFTVKFNGQVSVAGSPCDPQYLWDFGDGETSVEQNPAHTFRQDGKYTVTLEARDWLHPASSAKATTVIEVRMPKIRLSATLTPLSGGTPLTVNGHAVASQEGNGNTPMKYFWDFGDGSVIEGPDQKHTFTVPGTYNVLVFVEDPTLGNTERKTFKVVAK